MIPKEELLKAFVNSNTAEKTIIEDVINDMYYFREQIDELEALPLIRYSQKDPARQQLTPAAKLINDLSNKIDNKRKILLSILGKNNSSAADELLAKLKEFE